MSLVARVTRACVVLAAGLATPLAGQTGYQFASTPGRASLLDRPALLEVRAAPLAVGLMELQQSSGVALAFSPSLLKDAPAVTCLCRAATVGEALDRMLAPTSFTYEELAGQVLIEPVRRPHVVVADAGGGPPPALAAIEIADDPAPPAPETRAATMADGAFRPWAGRVPVVGQATGSIRGRVVEAGSGRPLTGAQVYVPGTGHGALTNATGAYVIAGIEVGARQVRAEMLGFATLTKPVTVVADQPAQVDFELAASAISLDEMVITGVPGAVSKRTIGNSISTINVADVANKVSISNVTQLLQAKAPGVSVLSSSGSPGTASDIRIRGVSSLSASSFPVVFVDGVRIYSGPTGAFRNNWMAPAAGQVSTGGQTSYAIDDINPDDIESIEVIKGPAAATLYGADAANGVIQIITKKGKPGQQKLQWNAKLESGQRAWALDTRTTYTTCTAAMVSDPLHTYGGADGNHGCIGQAPGTVLAENFLGGALQTGNIQNLALSVRGGGDGYSFFVAGENALDNGVFANSWDKRSAFRSNFSFYPSEQVDFTINVGFGRSQTRFPSTDNGGSLMNAAWTYQPGLTPPSGQQYGFGASTPAVMASYDNRILSDRTTIGTTLNYRPFSWFKNRLVVGADANSRQANRYIPPGTPFSPPEGQMTQGMPRDNLYSVDYAGTITHSLLPDVASALSFGLQYVDRESRNTVAQGTGYPTDAVQNVGSAQTRVSWDEYLSVKSLGFFGQEQLTFKDRLYLTGALRVDNSSVFGADIKRLYYPKVSISWVISDESFFRRYTWLNNLKLRAAWGQAGNAPDPFARSTTYGLQQVVPPCFTSGAACENAQQFSSGAYLTAMGNPSVKPERGDEIEMGFDAGILNNRAGLEFTFYNKTTRDALMPVPFIGGPSAGFSGSIWQNVGQINNKGIELGLTATPIQSRLLTWDSRLGVSTNANKLVKFGYKADTLFYALTTTNQRTVPGYPLAGFWVHDPVPDQTSTDGFRAGPARYLGPSMPTREVSFANTFTIRRNLQVFALLDYKGGNYLLDQTGETLCRQGLCKEVNDPTVPAERVAMLKADLTENDALWTYKADFIKFRDLSLTYTLPSAWTARVGSDRTSVTLAAHNLGFLWKPYYKGLDPEVTFNGVNDPKEDGQAFGWIRADYFTVPMT
ncbi:MAG: SusC/RagA family TonB-linked outer membrane protein, partial [Betaproteobacteria bacterium]